MSEYWSPDNNFAIVCPNRVDMCSYFEVWDMERGEVKRSASDFRPMWNPEAAHTLIYIKLNHYSPILLNWVIEVDFTTGQETYLTECPPFFKKGKYQFDCGGLPGVRLSGQLHNLPEGTPVQLRYYADGSQEPSWLIPYH